MALEINDDNITDTIKHSKLTLIDFWAPWCGPCRMIGPIIDELSKDNIDVNIGKVNIDSNPISASHFNVKSIPTLMFFKNGEMVKKLVGVSSKNQLQNIINELKS